MKRFNGNQSTPGSRWTAARTAAGRIIGLLLLFVCINSLVAPIDLSSAMRASSAPNDPVSVIVQRFNCLQGHLPKDRVLGYWQSPQIQDADGLNYSLIDYSLPPHVFVQQQSQWMVLNFSNWKSALRGVSQFPGYHVDHDCENGILLISSAG